MLESVSAVAFGITEYGSDHAALYDAAFDWDVHGQVNAISLLSGITQGRVLERPQRIHKGSR
jgi:hypothetical protein